VFQALEGMKLEDGSDKKEGSGQKKHPGFGSRAYSSLGLGNGV
jgi:hypothetical protein